MNPLFLRFAPLWILLTIAFASGSRAATNVENGFVTLTVSGIYASNRHSSFDISSSQMAELISFPFALNWQNSIYYSFIRVTKDGRAFDYTRVSNSITQLDPLIVSGPATVELRYDHPVATAPRGLCTFRVSPSSLADFKDTIIVPAGGNGAVISLQCSTNLIDWATATNGAYAGQPQNKFFRIRVDQIPP